MFRGLWLTSRIFPQGTSTRGIKFGMICLGFFGGHVKQVQGIQAFCALTQVGLGDWDLDLVVSRYAPNGSGYHDMKGR